MLVVAVGWPSMATATAEPPATKAEPATEPEPNAEPEPSAEPEPDAEARAPKARPPSSPGKLTPEEIERRQTELRTEQATLHWQEGKRLYQNGRYAEAAVEFEKSQVAWPAAATLYSMALSYERAAKPVEAVRALQRYLALPDCSDVPPEEGTMGCTQQRAQAEQALAEQRRRVGELVIALGEGVELREVRVAGRTVPLDDFPLVLLPGTVDVEVFGLKPDERRSRPAYITAGESFTLYVAPFDSESQVVRSPVLPPPNDDPVDELRLERRQRQLVAAFGVGAGLTAASGVAMAVTGGLALYHQRRFDTELCPNPCVVLNEDGTPMLDPNGNTIPRGTAENDVYPDDHEAELARYRPIANALMGVTVGLAVATALVGTFAFRKRDRERASGPQSNGKRVRARVRVGGSGLVVRW